MKKLLLRHYVFYCFCSLLLSAVPSAAQSSDSVQVELNGKPAGETFIHSIRHNNISYLSIFDVARILGLKTYYNPTLKKLEVNFDKAKIKFTADNPFFVVTDHATYRETILQFPAPVLELHDTLFGPAPFLITVVNSFSTTVMQIKETPVLPESVAMTKEMNVTGTAVEGRKNGILVRIFTKQKFADLSRFIRNNEWLYVTIPNGWGDTLALDSTKPDAFLYQLVAVQSPTSLQLSFHMRQKFDAAEIFQDSVNNDILVTLRTAVVAVPRSEDSLWAKEKIKEHTDSIAHHEVSASNSSSDSATIASLQPNIVPEKNNNEATPIKEKSSSDQKASENTIASGERETESEELQHHKEMLATLKKKRARWKLDVVVLDPGHGGNDPGSIGIIGTREKDITLGIALKLGKLIERYLPDVKVVYTRKTDHFVELYRRGQIANENQGKLFISIHCNSLEQKPSPTHGFEIFLLRPGKTEDAIKIAQKENAVVQLEQDYQDRYQEITQENFIILTMAQSAYMHNSEQFAEILQQEMGRNLSSESHSVKQAGFYVLVGASMPNVLIETGYLSNRKDEMFLRSPEGQQIIAEDILRALEKYKKEYEKALEE